MALITAGGDIAPASMMAAVAQRTDALTLITFMLFKRVPTARHDSRRLTNARSHPQSSHLSDATPVLRPCQERRCETRGYYTGRRRRPLSQSRIGCDSGDSPANAGLGTAPRELIRSLAVELIEFSRILPNRCAAQAFPRNLLRPALAATVHVALEYKFGLIGSGVFNPPALSPSKMVTVWPTPVARMGSSIRLHLEPVSSPHAPGTAGRGCNQGAAHDILSACTRDHSGDGAPADTGAIREHCTGSSCGLKKRLTKASTTGEQLTWPRCKP